MLPPFFFILTLYLWDVALRRGFSYGWTIALGIAVGFSTTAYQSTRLTALLFSIAIAIFILRHAPRRISALLIFGSSVVFGALTQIAVFFTDPAHFLARSRDTVVHAASVPEFIFEVLRNSLVNIGPSYLFVPNMVETYMTSARLLPIEALLFYPGLYLLRFVHGKTSERLRAWVYVSLVIGILPAALSNQNPHSLRASGIAILTPLISAATVTWVRDFLKKRNKSTRAADITFGSAIVASALVVVFIYIRNPMARAERMQPEITLAARAVGARQQQYPKVFFENAGYQPYIYVVAFTGMTPEEYRSVPKQMGESPGRMDDVKQIGKYYFVDSTAMRAEALESSARGDRALFVSRAPLPGTQVLDSVSSVWHKYYIAESGAAAPH
jgi:hypothetical protein